MRWLLLCLWLVAGSAWAQEISNLTRLRELAETVRGTPRELSVLLSLYKNERFAGNHVRAAGVRERILAHPSGSLLVQMSVHFLDAEFLAQNADPRGARAQWEQGAALFSQMEAEGAQRLYQQRGRARQEAALASILRVEGRTEEAGQALDRALAANAQDIRLFREGAGSSRPNAERDLATAENDRADLLSELITLRIATGRIGAAELVVLDWLQAARAAGKAMQITGGDQAAWRRADGRRPFRTRAAALRRGAGAPARGRPG
jgi:NACalpha-BTF3-like transcription factor